MLTTVKLQATYEIDLPEALHNASQEEVFSAIKDALRNRLDDFLWYHFTKVTMEGDNGDFFNAEEEARLNKGR